MASGSHSASTPAECRARCLEGLRAQAAVGREVRIHGQDEVRVGGEVEECIGGAEESESGIEQTDARHEASLRVGELPDLLEVGLRQAVGEVRGDEFESVRRIPLLRK
jgi:hypothetical protein